MARTKENTGTLKKRCFVVMGLGIKTDYATGRKIDLNKSYRLLIKPVVEGLGLECVRVDELIHSGSIDLPMYKELLEAEIVIADLSTANVNAFYELGIRHALRPRSTLVISEDKLSYPFDLNHISILSYTHVGEGIEYEEVERFRKILGNQLKAILDSQVDDSPVYTYLEGLIPPHFSSSADLESALVTAGPVQIEVREDKPNAQQNEDPSLAKMIEQGEQLIKDKKFAEAKDLFENVFKLKNDPYILQKLIEATYQCEIPNPLDALFEARSRIEELSLHNSNNIDTLELLGKIEFALYNETNDRDRLVRARTAYERLYAQSKNFQIGLILSYIASLHAEYRHDDIQKLADIVLINRIRKEVIENGSKKLVEIETTYSAEARLSGTPKMTAAKKEKFAVWCTIAEAYYSLGDKENYAKSRNEAALLRSKGMGFDELDQQIRRLEPLLKNQFALINSFSSFLATDVSIKTDPAALRPQAFEANVEPPNNDNADTRNVIFFSYSHNDKSWLDEIKKTLVPVFRNKPVSLWDDIQIKPGEVYRDSISNALSKAKGVILLVSRDFLASKFIAENELPKLLKDAWEKGVILMWIAVEDCIYDEEEFEKYQCLNNPATPLTMLDKKTLNREIVSICKKVRDRIFPK